MRNIVGRLTLGLHKLGPRVLDKAWSLLASGGFASFGKKSVVARPCRLEGAEHVHIGDSVWIGPDSWLQCVPAGESATVRIGDRVTASGSLVLSAASSIVVEDDVLFARNVYVSDHIHRYDDTELPVHAQGVAKVAPVRIARGAWLGQNVVVCPGVTIGKGAVIGAGSVVNADVPDYSVAVGAPARVVKRFGAEDAATTHTNAAAGAQPSGPCQGAAASQTADDTGELTSCPN